MRLLRDLFSLTGFTSLSPFRVKDRKTGRVYTNEQKNGGDADGKGNKK